MLSVFSCKETVTDAKNITNTWMSVCILTKPYFRSHFKRTPECALTMRECTLRFRVPLQLQCPCMENHWRISKKWNTAWCPPLLPLEGCCVITNTFLRLMEISILFFIYKSNQWAYQWSLFIIINHLLSSLHNSNHAKGIMDAPG